jgi:hypothetical protein
MSRYAERTTVGSDASRTEIERTLRRYGASAFGYGWEGSQATVMFVLANRRIRFHLPLPDPNDKQFTHTPGRGQRRTADAQEREYEQAVRQRWRALALVIKAKLEAVEAGISSVEDEFLSWTLLPDGRTVGQVIAPQIEASYATGQMPPLLAIEGGDR